MHMPHAAVLTNRQTLAGGLKFRHADFLALAGLQALGRAFVSGSHGAVTGDVFLDFFFGVLRHSGGRQQGQSQGDPVFFHGVHFD